MFVDDKERQWSLANVSTLELNRFAGVSKLDLADLDGPAVDELHDDQPRLAEVLWIACAEQAQARGISYADFAESLTSERARAYAIASLVEVMAGYQQLRDMSIQLAEQCHRLRIAINEYSRAGEEAFEARIVRRMNVAAAQCIAEWRQAFKLALANNDLTVDPFLASLERFSRSFRGE